MSPVMVKAAAPSGDLALYGFSAAGWATFGLRLDSGLAYDSLVAVGATYNQTTVYQTHPNGSIKHGIVTCKLPSSGNYIIRQGAATTGTTFSPTNPSGAVTFTIGGNAYVAAIPAFSAADSPMAGPLLREARYVVVPTVSGTPHPLLQVIFDIRSYFDGGHRVDVAVQSTRNIVGGTYLTCDFDVTINGSSVYSKAGAVILYTTRPFRRLFYVSLTMPYITPDFAPFQACGAVPEFLSTIGNPTPVSTGAQFDIGGYGDMYASMQTGGGRPDIGPLPYFHAHYVQNRTEAQWNYIVAQSAVSGGWYGHFGNADGVTIPTLTDNPNWYFDFAGNGGLDGPLATRTNFSGLRQPGGSNSFVCEMIEVNHQPTLNYLPYLLTGDRWYADQMMYWANWTLLNSQQGRDGVNGYILYEGGNQTRGVAWGLRALGEAGACLPDAHPNVAYIRTVAQNNLNLLDSYWATLGGGTFNWAICNPGQSFGAVRDDARGRFFSMWQNAYVIWTMLHLADLGYTVSTALAQRVAENQVQLMTSAGAGFPQNRGAVGWIYVSATGSGVTPFDTLMSQVETHTTAQDGRDLAWSDGYAEEARINLLIGVKLGVTGAAAQLAYLMAESGVATRVNNMAGFALTSL